MTEKLKVDRPTAEALKDLLSRDKKDYSFEFILSSHAGIMLNKRDVWDGDSWNNLNKLTISEMAQAIYVGYEVVETKEEKILSLYSKITSSIYSGDAVRKVIVGVLDILEVEVEGVNVVTDVFE